jgi:hypothetical protein
VTTLAIVVFGLWFLSSAVMCFACCRIGGWADERDRLDEIAPSAAARPTPLYQRHRGARPTDRGREMTAS